MTNMPDKILLVGVISIATSIRVGNVLCNRILEHLLPPYLYIVLISDVGGIDLNKEISAVARRCLCSRNKPSNNFFYSFTNLMNLPAEGKVVTFFIFFIFFRTDRIYTSNDNFGIILPSWINFKTWL